MYFNSQRHRAFNQFRVKGAAPPPPAPPPPRLLGPGRFGPLTVPGRSVGRVSATPAVTCRDLPSIRLFWPLPHSRDPLIGPGVPCYDQPGPAVACFAGWRERGEGPQRLGGAARAAPPGAAPGSAQPRLFGVLPRHSGGDKRVQVGATWTDAG